MTSPTELFDQKPNAYASAPTKGKIPKMISSNWNSINMGRVWLLVVLNRLFSPVATVLRVFRLSCPSFPMTIMRMMTSSPSLVRTTCSSRAWILSIDIRQGLNSRDTTWTTNDVLELTKPSQWFYSMSSTRWYSIAKSAWLGVVSILSIEEKTFDQSVNPASRNTV